MDSLYYLSRDRWNLYYTWVQRLLRMDRYYNWVQLLHLCLPQVPLTRNSDPSSEFGLRGNQTFSLLGGIFRGVIFSHISSLTWDQDMCHLYQSVNKAKAKSENLSNVEIKGEKKIHTFRLWGARNDKRPKNACSSSPRRKRHLCAQAKAKMKQSKANFIS